MGLNYIFISTNIIFSLTYFHNGFKLLSFKLGRIYICEKQNRREDI